MFSLRKMLPLFGAVAVTLGLTASAGAAPITSFAGSTGGLTVSAAQVSLPAGILSGVSGSSIPPTFPGDTSVVVPPGTLTTSGLSFTSAGAVVAPSNRFTITVVGSPNLAPFGTGSNGGTVSFQFNSAVAITDLGGAPGSDTFKVSAFLLPGNTTGIDFGSSNRVFNFTFTTNGTTFSGGTFGTNSTTSASFSANATTAFDFGPGTPGVPEPATLATLGLMGVCGYFTRRKLKAASVAQA